MIALLLALAAGPHAETLLSPAQRERVREQAARIEEAKAAKGDPRALLRQILTADRAAFGMVRGSNEELEARLIDEEVEHDSMREAVALSRARLARTRLLRGEGHWATEDAAEGLAVVETVAALDDAGRKDYRRLEGWLTAGTKPSYHGLLSKGERLGERSLALAERLFGKVHAVTLAALRLLAQEQWLTGRFAEQLATTRRALALCRKLKGPRHPRTAGLLNGLAAALRDQGEADAALAPAREAVAIYRATMGEGHLFTAHARETLSNIHQKRGEFAEARRQFLLCQRTREALLAPAHPALGDLLYNLGSLQQQAGDDAAALDALLRCGCIYREAHGGGYPGEAAVLDLIGRSLSRLGRGREALARFIEAGKIYIRQGRTRTRQYADLLSCLGLEAGLSGDTALAERSHRLALEIARETGHPELHTFLLNAAQGGRDAGDRDAALRLAAEGERLARAKLPGHHPRRAYALDVLSSVRQSRGEHAEAREAGTRGLESARRYLALASGAQSEREQLLAEARLRAPLGLLLSLPPDPASDHAQTFAWKGAVQANQQAQRSAGRIADPRLVAEWDEAARELGRLSVLGGKAERIDALARRKEALEARLALASEGYRAARGAVAATPESLRRLLPEDAALVDFFVYRWSDYARPVRERFRARLTAFILRRGRPTARVELGGLDALSGAINAWRKDTGSGRNGAALRRLLWLPLEPHLEGVSTVLLSPDGPVASVPFGALPGGKRGSFLLEERTFSVIPVPRSLAGGAKAGPAAPALLALGGVEYGEGKWPALPGTRAEASGVAKRFRGELLGGADATAGRLRASLPGKTHLHLATHGYAEPGHEAVLGLRCGLVLAGGEVLTAQELVGLDLSACRLAVLSACETGLGDIAAGEGVLGLQRALHIAGARTAVTSLWSVSDAATSLLMERFYDALSDSPPAEALRRAQLYVIRHPGEVEERGRQLARGLKAGERLRGAGMAAEKIPGGTRRSPVSWWGAFVLSGDWR